MDVLTIKSADGCTVAVRENISGSFALSHMIPGQPEWFSGHAYFTEDEAAHAGLEWLLAYISDQRVDEHARAKN